MKEFPTYSCVKECCNCDFYMDVAKSNFDFIYPWFDVDETLDCCSDDCCEEITEDLSWEYIDELNWLKDRKADGTIKPEHVKYLEKLEKRYKEWRIA